MSRCVRGSFFSEYVRMIRRRKEIDWESILPPEDVQYVWQYVDPDRWYPMETFERLGVAILSELPGATLDSVRHWGWFSSRQLSTDQPELVVPNDPVESLMRLKVLRSTLFNFPAFDIPMLVEGHAHITITYHMGPVAEEAACYQTMGFCEGVVSLAGALETDAQFEERAWTGQPRTLINLKWTQ